MSTSLGGVWERAADDFKERASWLFRTLAAEGIDPRVLQIMSRVPRHRFVPPELAGDAYENIPLPIGHGQTISQPYIVGLMTEALALRPDDIVLEVGTGCGYQSAILSLVARLVYSVEIVPDLARESSLRLEGLGYRNVEVRCSDGYLGWPEHAPYDAICVTASAPEVPPPLLAQLAPGGRMVIPVYDDLLLVTKDDRGHVRQRSLCPVAFVPLTRARDAG